MKKLFSAMALFTLLLSCNNAGNDGPVTDSTSINNTPSAIDTTQHPNGITNGSVISTGHREHECRKYENAGSGFCQPIRCLVLKGERKIAGLS